MSQYSSDRTITTHQSANVDLTSTSKHSSQRSYSLFCSVNCSAAASSNDSDAPLHHSCYWLTTSPHAVPRARDTAPTCKWVCLKHEIDVITNINPVIVKIPYKWTNLIKLTTKNPQPILYIVVKYSSFSANISSLADRTVLTVALLVQFASVCRLYGIYCGQTERPRAKVTIESLQEVVYEKSIRTKMKDLDLRLEVVSSSCQPLHDIRR